MVKQKDFVHPKSPEECDSLGNIEGEFEEYSEEELPSHEESNQNIHKQPSKEDSSEERYLVEGSCVEKPNGEDSSDEESPEEVPCEEKPDGEYSCAEGPNEEDSDKEPYEEEESEEDSKEGTTPEETSEGPSEEYPTEDATFDETVEEELSEESEEEHDGEEPLRGFMYKIPYCNDSGQVSVCLLEEKKASDHRFSESKTSAESSGNQCLRKSENLSADATVSKQVDVSETSSKKKRHSRWDIKAEDPILVNKNGDLNKRRRTRWSSDEAPLNMSDILKVVNSVKDALSCNTDEHRIQKLQAKLQLINEKLAATVIVDEQPKEKCSPSPPPIDDGLGIRMNNRKSRLRLKLIEQKNRILLELLTYCKKQPKLRPTSDHFPVICKKLYIPSKEYPSYNFVGLIIGPQGKTLKKMEEETGAKIRLRGRGSKRKEENDPNDEDLHVLIEAASQISVDAAVNMVERLLVPVDDQYNYHKANQLRELAASRGTLREGNAFKMDSCDICGSSSHATSGCPLTATPQTNTNFLTGSGSLFSSFKSPSISPSPMPLAAKTDGGKLEKEIDEANLYVGYLPQTVSDDKLKELFLPFGTLCEVHVIKDRNTGQSKGYGFVKYTNASDAAKAIAQMNGYSIDGKWLAVRVAGIPLSSSNANLPNYVVAGTSPSNANLPNYIAGTLPPPKKGIDLADLFVGYLPQTVSDDKLKELFLPFGTCEAKVMNDRSTGQSKGYGFVKYTSASDAAKAVAQMNGYFIDGKWLAVRVAGIPPSDTNLSNYVVAGISTLNANQPNYRVAGTFPHSSNANLPFPCLDAISQEIRDPNCWPGPPGSMLPESVSSELASFPGYLKSIEPPNLFDQSTPSSSVSSRPPCSSNSLFSNQMNPTWM